MFEQVIVAEKHSLAKAIAEALEELLGVKMRKEDGYYVVGDYVVTWLAGHMLETAQPGAYREDWKRWNMAVLPMVPTEWKTEPSKGKDGKPDQGKLKQVGIVGDLIGRSKVVVNAGDAAREGQLLVDEVLVHLGKDPFGPDVKRLWVKSYVRKDMLAALKSMAPNASKKGLYEAALCRQRADWIHGLNLTRCYSLRAGEKGHDIKVSVGRVQTPTLKLVVDRDMEIERFRPVDYYTPVAICWHTGGSFRGAWVTPDDHPGLDSDGRLIDKAVAEGIAAAVKGKTGKVSKFDAAEKRDPQPLVYSLSALQKDCSAKFGLTAQETLDIAQTLYEKHKATTYPRSDSQHLPKAMLEEAPKIVANLGRVSALAELVENADLTIVSRVWDDSKVSDHHGIVPTAEAPDLTTMTEDERKVFDLIARTFLAQFFQEFRYRAVTAYVDVEGHAFKATGRRTLDVGWKAVFGHQQTEDDESEGDAELPEMKTGDAVEVRDAGVNASKTKPPSPFTDGTLIDAMAGIHRLVSDPQVKAKLKENSGLGTEATRASIIEKLISNGYLSRIGSGKSKKFRSTSKGRAVIAAVVAADPMVADPGMTALWEEQLAEVERGTREASAFMGRIVGYVTHLVQTSKPLELAGVKPKFEPLPGHGKECPMCGEGRMRTRVGKVSGKRFLGCDRHPECDHVEWAKDEIKPLAGHGDACPDCDGTKVTKQVFKDGPTKGNRFLACSLKCGWREFPEEGGWEPRGGKKAAGGAA